MLRTILCALVLISPMMLLADKSQGETLENKLWDTIKSEKWDDFDNLIAPYFQLALFDGARNKDQYITLSKKLNVKDLTLSNFAVTEGPDIVIVTYDASVSENLEGKPIISKATRLSVWHKNKDKWILAAHSILIPVPPSEK